MSWQRLVAAFAEVARQDGERVPARFCGLTDGDGYKMGLPWLFCWKEIADVCRRRGVDWTAGAIERMGVFGPRQQKRLQQLVRNEFAAATERTVQECKREWAGLIQGKERQDEDAAIAFVLMLAFRKEAESVVRT